MRLVQPKQNNSRHEIIFSLQRKLRAQKETAEKMFPAVYEGLN
jgi:hypothetical protein